MPTQAIGHVAGINAASIAALIAVATSVRAQTDSTGPLGVYGGVAIVAAQTTFVGPAPHVFSAYAGTSVGLGPALSYGYGWRRWEVHFELSYVPQRMGGRSASTTVLGPYAIRWR